MVAETEVKEAVSEKEASQTQPTQTKEQQILNAFNTALNLIVRELNILYSNVQSILSNN